MKHLYVQVCEAVSFRDRNCIQDQCRKFILQVGVIYVTTLQTFTGARNDTQYVIARGKAQRQYHFALLVLDSFNIWLLRRINFQPWLWI